MAARFVVGSFAKSTDAAPAAQVVAHGMSGTPTAIIFWMSGHTSADAFATGARACIGFTTGASNSYAMAAGMDDAAATTVTAQRLAAKAITIISGDETLLAEADITSITGSNINLNWTTNDASANIINFMAFGGDISQAKVVNWQGAATGSPTEHTVTGFGFEPDCLLTLAFGYTDNPPFTGAGAELNFGVATKGGQWVTAIRDDDNLATTNSVRSHLGAMLTRANDIEEAFIQKWDTDGFTACFTEQDATSTEIITLGMRGATFLAGTVMKTNDAATATQKISGYDGLLAARGVILSTVASPTTFIDATAQGRFSLGASDGTNERAIAIQTADNVADSAVDNYTASAKALLVVNNATPALDAACDVTIADSNVTLSWTTNAAVHTLLSYLVILDGPTGGGGGGGGGGQGGGNGGGNGGGGGGGNGGGNPGGGGPPGGNGGGKNHFFTSTLRKRRKWFSGF
jgi:hypothetical protein